MSGNYQFWVYKTADGEWTYQSAYFMAHVPEGAKGPYTTYTEARSVALQSNGRFTLSDFARDKNTLLAWLNHDGKPPTALVPKAADGHRHGRGISGFYSWATKVTKAVTKSRRGKWMYSIPKLTRSKGL